MSAEEGLLHMIATVGLLVLIAIGFSTVVIISAIELSTKIITIHTQKDKNEPPSPPA